MDLKWEAKSFPGKQKKKMLRQRDLNPPGLGHLKMGTFTVRKTSDFSGESRICRGKAEIFEEEATLFG